jgi:hypothetical protein
LPLNRGYSKGAEYEESARFAQQTIEAFQTVQRNSQVRQEAIQKLSGLEKAKEVVSLLRRKKRDLEVQALNLTTQLRSLEMGLAESEGAVLRDTENKIILHPLSPSLQNRLPERVMVPTKGFQRVINLGVIVVNICRQQLQLELQLEQDARVALLSVRNSVATPFIVNDISRLIVPR